MQLAPICRRGEKAAGSQTGTHSLFDHAPSSAELGEFMSCLSEFIPLCCQMSELYYPDKTWGHSPNDGNSKTDNRG